MRYVAGIDGGGTKARLRVVDENQTEVYSAQGKSTNIYSVKAELACSNLISLIKSSPFPLSSLCFASAGLGREAESSYFKALLNNHFPQTKLYLASDSEALLVGSLDSLEGSILIAGTGSIAMGRLKDGTIVRKGGFGYRLGDEGSAWFIASQAVIRTLKSNENRDYPTSLAPFVLNYFHLQNLTELIPLFNSDSLSKAEVANFAPLVAEAAIKGDELSNAILKQCGKELASLLLSLLTDNDALKHHPIVLAGGVLEHAELVLDYFKAELKEFDLQFVMNNNKALDGAVKLAFPLL